jgi:N-acetylglucosamine malate deacetylase 1
MRTLLVALSHPDDEVGCVGTIMAHRARGDRVVLLWLSRGEMTGVFGPLPLEEVARRRVEYGEEVARRLDCEHRFLEFPDTRIEATPDALHAVAAVLAGIRPDGVITWGDAWNRGFRHPDHRATGQIVLGAVTLARIERVVAPLPPHREPAPLFTIRDVHSGLPVAAVDVSPYRERIHEIAGFYRERVKWPQREWLEARLRSAGDAWGVEAAELFDAWETPGGLGATLF